MLNSNDGGLDDAGEDGSCPAVDEDTETRNRMEVEEGGEEGSGSTIMSSRGDAATPLDTIVGRRTMATKSRKWRHPHWTKKLRMGGVADQESSPWTLPLL